MKLSEMVGKEIVNLNDGSRLGVVGESDLVIDGRNGAIHSIVLPNRSTPLNFWSDNKPSLVIPWEAVKKVGTEVIIVELSEEDLTG